MCEFDGPGPPWCGVIVRRRATRATVSPAAADAAEKRFFAVSSSARHEASREPVRDFFFRVSRCFASPCRSSSTEHLVWSSDATWLSGSVVRTSVFGWRTFPSDLWLTCDDHFVDKLSAVGQPTRRTQPSTPPGSVNEY